MQHLWHKPNFLYDLLYNSTPISNIQFAEYLELCQVVKCILKKATIFKYIEQTLRKWFSVACRVGDVGSEWRWWVPIDVRYSRQSLVISVPNLWHTSRFIEHAFHVCTSNVINYKHGINSFKMVGIMMMSKEDRPRNIKFEFSIFILHPVIKMYHGIPKKWRIPGCACQISFTPETHNTQFQKYMYPHRFMARTLEKIAFTW